MSPRWEIHQLTWSKELGLMLQLMKRYEENGVAEHIGKWLDDIDWNQFVELVRHHRVFPTVYAAMKKLPPQLIPADVLEALTLDCTRNTFRMLQLTAELKQVAEQMASENIRMLVLKGPLLAQELYSDVSMRASKDLDVLIPLEDVERAESALKDQGYVIKDPKLRLINDWKWKDHHQSYYHPGKQIQVELHWRLHPDSGRESSFDELWSQRRASVLTGYPIYCMGKEEMMDYLVAHGARHAWFRLRWLADIDRMIRMNMDYERLIKLFYKNGSQHLGGQALLLASSFLGTPIPYMFQPLYSGKKSRKLASQAAFFMENKVQICPEPTADIAGKYKSYMLSLKSWRQRTAYLLRRLYPSSSDAEVFPLPKGLHFLYFPLRPFLWFYRRVRQSYS
ncbi:nucleotidyltransferase family protein [Paenibacillus sp. GCM10012307]|uniref:Nucleotidyltransferase family protein n=1 Tax=Paenibacillus roseus TaxID=2798579 RepID=A0A934J2G9_9BACL|nr:nucleotidyltransferase family protein [Paenibacillus roseus]MBJ6360243.1 nucleotidyltransferase family protein [Paenibacillus roseus]